jgi:hypothetical protein
MTKLTCSACGRPAKGFMECLGVIVCPKCGDRFEMSNDEMAEAERWKAIWAGEIRAAQLVRTIKIGGKSYKRIRYGNDYPGWKIDEYRETCHDCGVKLDQYHVPGCDVECCPGCGGQLISCDCRRGRKPSHRSRH